VPKTTAVGGVFLPLTGEEAGTEQISGRIVETPANVEDTEVRRNPRSGFIAYVPPGSVKKGEVLVTTGGGKTTACTVCHGVDLRGLGPVPMLAGRSPSYLGRQLYDMQHGNRTGMWTPLMAPVVSKLSDEDILNAAAKRGKIVHESVENFLKYGVDDHPPEYAGYYNAFKSWWREKQPELIESENRTYHSVLRYAGTADLICKVNGSLLCIDFKTSVQIVEMLARVQLEAYERAYASHDIKFDAKAIVQLQKDGQWAMRLFLSKDSEPWEVFCSLLTVYNYTKKYGR
jgi:cytochrome c553